jgi:hypothetical protein
MVILPVTLTHPGGVLGADFYLALIFILFFEIAPLSKYSAIRIGPKSDG